MNTPEYPERPSRKRERESLLALFFLIFGIVLLFLIGVILIRFLFFPPNPEIETETTTEEETTTGEPAPKDPVPVFPTDAVLPAVPADSDDCAVLTDAVSSEYAVLVDVSAGKVLAGKNADTKFAPASLTKVMTLAVACLHLNDTDLDETVEMTSEIHDYVHPPKSAGSGYYDSDCYGFDVGDEAKVRDLLYGIGVSSSADCTMMVVRYLYLSEEAFVEEMNAVVSELGLQNTHFDNAIGYESDENYTTPREFAAILRYALQCPLIKQILSTPKWDFSYSGFNSRNEWVTVTTAHVDSTLFNVNELGNSRFKAFGIKVGGTLSLDQAVFLGGKTGSLKVDGQWYYSLASFAESKKEHHLYVAVTGDTTLPSGVVGDAKTLFNAYIK